MKRLCGMALALALMAGPAAGQTGGGPASGG